MTAPERSMIPGRRTRASTPRTKKPRAIVTLSTCFYCGMPASRCEQDHFPIPAEVGGTETVPACINCHDLKDRHLMESWPFTEAQQAVLELHRVEGKLSGIMCLEMWGQWEDEPHTLPPRWDEYSPLARIAWAKMLRSVLVGEHLGHPSARPSAWIKNGLASI